MSFCIPNFVNLAMVRVRWGYRRLHGMLRREGLGVNVKRVYRLYREDGLAVRRRKRKRVAVARQPMAVPTRLNECWAMDFMSDVEDLPPQERNI